MKGDGVWQRRHAHHIAAMRAVLDRGPITITELVGAMFRDGVEVSKRTVQTMTASLADEGAIKAEKIRTAKCRTGVILLGSLNVDAAAWDAAVRRLHGERQVFGAARFGRLVDADVPVVLAVHLKAG